MKKLLIYALLTLFSSTLQGQDFLGFKQVILGPYKAFNRNPNQSIMPGRFDANSFGGYAELTVNHLVGNRKCPTKYQFNWKFLKPVDRLYKNQPVQLQYEVKLLGQACQAGKAKMIAHAAGGFSPNFQRTGIRNSGGLTVKPANWVQAGFSGPVQSHLTTINVFNPSVQYGTVRLNFEVTGYRGSDMAHFEVIYIFQKNFGNPPVVQDTPTTACNEGSWYREAEPTHPWTGMSMHQIRQQGYQESFYYGSMTWGWNYFLSDPKGNTVRVFGTRIYYVNWDCFEQHHRYVNRKVLNNDRRLSHKDRWRRNKDGFEFDIVYVAR